MSTYFRNQPVATDDLDVSQPFLVTNTNTADTVFGIEHYAFSNTSANQGLHNTITTPAYQNPIGTPSASPPTTVASPIMYCFQDAANIGVLQYSRGPNNSVPSPITTLQSPSSGISLAFNATTNVLDFTGVTTFAVCMLYGIKNGTTSSPFIVTFSQASGGSVSLLGPNSGIAAQFSGKILQIVNSFGGTANFWWTLQFLRIQ